MFFMWSQQSLWLIRVWFTGLNIMCLNHLYQEPKKTRSGQRHILMHKILILIILSIVKQGLLILMYFYKVFHFFE